MSEDSEQQIARLMAEGLDHYGLDRVADAVKCWQAVLQLNPNHQLARDYLSSAGFTADEGAAVPDAPGTSGDLVAEAVALITSGQAAEALDLLETLTKDGTAGLEVHGYIELIRGHLLRKYRARMGAGQAVPALSMAPDELMKFNLPANAGFVLSMVDGATPVDDLVAVTGMDPFEALRTLGKLADAGIVEIRA